MGVYPMPWTEYFLKKHPNTGRNGKKLKMQWNVSVAITSIIKITACDLFSNVF